MERSFKCGRHVEEWASLAPSSMPIVPLCLACLVARRACNLLCLACLAESLFALFRAGRAFCSCWCAFLFAWHVEAQKLQTMPPKKVSDAAQETNRCKDGLNVWEVFLFPQSWHALRMIIILTGCPIRIYKRASQRWTCSSVPTIKN